MYGFEPDQEQTMLVEAAKRFAESDVAPLAHEADEDGSLPGRVIEKGWGLGVVQASVPEDYGGFGQRSVVSNALAAEELAAGDLAAALAVLLPATFVVPLLVAGSEEQKGQWLPPVVEGAWQPYSAAWVEPDFDFTPDRLRTRAEAAGDGYRLNGRKAFVAYADRAPALLVYASLEDKPAVFVVPKATPGVTIGARQRLLGLGALPMYSVELAEVVLPLDAHLASGPANAIGQLVAASQVGVAAMAVGMSRAAYEYALAYAKGRVAFGEPIAHKQSIAFMLAEMATEIEAVRLMVWQAAWQLDQAQDASQSAYLALMGAADMAMMVTDRAVQILGGHGYIREHPVERWMRNGRGIGAFVGVGMV
ncbi:MAG TPA: acyl-CoA dehydrogenase family protein [Anaerolineales bacterium]|jgi:alkylation response protein AidB-like acyl-CoA dehydrogenase